MVEANSRDVGKSLLVLFNALFSCKLVVCLTVFHFTSQENVAEANSRLAGKSLLILFCVLRLVVN